MAATKKNGTGRSIKKLMKNEIDSLVSVTGPFSAAEIDLRHDEYKKLPAEEFQKKYRSLVYEPAIIKIDGNDFEIQLNKCNNPFCKWYGLPQVKYENIKSKPSRYKIVSSDFDNSSDRLLFCNDIPDPSVPGISLKNYTMAISNWAVAEEIKRLIKTNSIVPLKSEYEFHHIDCSKVTNPLDTPKDFYKRGKSTSNSQKYQCKECKKITNVLPSVGERFNYNHKLDGIMLDFAKDMISRTPVKKTCQKLGIGSGTYYEKMETLYKRCLEFLDEHEVKPLQTKQFESIMLCTDMFHYHLNNIRLKGSGGKPRNTSINSRIPTYIVASGDVGTGYIFRSDVAYDCDITIKDLINDTDKYHCDRSLACLRKNERLRYPYYPVRPFSYSPKHMHEYEEYHSEMIDREDYVQGMHVSSSYTIAAQMFLLQQLLKTDKWYFVSDDDMSIKSGILRVFSDEIRNGGSHYFTCQYQKELSLEDAGREFFRIRNELMSYAALKGIKEQGVMEIARTYLEEYFDKNEIYEYYPGTTIPMKSLGPITSPLSTKSEGTRKINFLTDTTELHNSELANIVARVNTIPVDTFFQKLRRSVNTLERPMVTARGDKKSYIYANYNPRYAQYAVTIFRTFYNFCWTTDVFGEKITPAQRIGIADKVYDIKDIIYFK